MIRTTYSITFTERNVKNCLMKEFFMLRSA